jgi:hypothetical protein
LLRFSFEGSEVVPHYFLEGDHLWLRALLDVYVAHEGRPRRELGERLQDPLPLFAPGHKLRIARHVLDGLWSSRTGATISPRRVRATLFAEAGRHPSREAAIATSSALLCASPDALMASLLADLPTEKLVAAPNAMPSAVELAQRCNMALVTGMLRRAVAVSIDADDNLRRVVRNAKLCGLLCTVQARGAAHERERIEISGPYTLFRRTLMYGRALASLISVAAGCSDVVLRAACVLDECGQTKTLIVRAGDPLFVQLPAKRHDSKLEERFFREMSRAAPAWDVIREPAAIPVEGTLVFPDFELRHRRDPARRWLVEIAGFWTPEYIEEKLRRLRKADIPRFILCIDAERNCTGDELPARAHVVRYRRRVDVGEVMRIIERAHDGGGHRSARPR